MPAETARGKASTEPRGGLIEQLTAATAQLTQAGVPSARHDAEALAAHVLGVSRSRLVLVRALDQDAECAFAALVARRASREPLQHLTGQAPFRHLALAVGPGVFIPRPETEGLLDLVLPELAPDAIAIDLCAGSGALALALAQERPDLTVHAVETDPAALIWLRRNAADAAVTVHDADVVALADALGQGLGDAVTGVPTLIPTLIPTDGAGRTVLDALAGHVGLVVSNPPYLPTGLVLEPEVADYDPPAALWGGVDGLDVIRAVVTVAGCLLAPGGRLALEHDASHQGAVLALLAGGGFDAVAGHRDLAGRDRYVTGAKMAL